MYRVYRLIITFSACMIPVLRCQHQLEGWGTSDLYCRMCADPPVWWPLCQELYLVSGGGPYHTHTQTGNENDVAPQTGTPPQKMGWKHIKIFSKLNAISTMDDHKILMFTLKAARSLVKEPENSTLPATGCNAELLKPNSHHWAISKNLYSFED
jgi:hypothetical protein